MWVMETRVSPLSFVYLFQEKELHGYCKLHSALWCLPNWSYWTKGHLLLLSVLRRSIELELMKYINWNRKLWSMLKQLVMSTSKNTIKGTIDFNFILSTNSDSVCCTIHIMLFSSFRCILSSRGASLLSHQ